MKKVLEHRGYSGSVEVSLEDRTLYGSVLHIDDLVTYEGTTVDELEAAFKATLDGYLAEFEEAGKPLPTPYKGTFNVRVGPDRHRQLAMLASRQGRSINDVIKSAVDCLFNVQRGLTTRSVGNMNEYASLTKALLTGEEDSHPVVYPLHTGTSWNDTIMAVFSSDWPTEFHQRKITYVQSTSAAAPVPSLIVDTLFGDPIGSKH